MNLCYAVTRFVLQWGSQHVRITNDEGHKLLSIAQTMLQLLFLPQFQPILLPKYVVELVALLVYGETCPLFATATQSEFQRLRQMVVRALPLRLSMTSLRAALGQTTASSGAVTLKPFKQLCGQLLSQLLMEEGGVLTTIEMLLGSVEEGNTQARVQVATLVSIFHCLVVSCSQLHASLTQLIMQCVDLSMPQWRRTSNIRASAQPSSQGAPVANAPRQQATV